MPDTSTAGINVGDAVVNFVGDMTQLDAGVDKLNARIESGMSRASVNVNQFGSALDDAGQKADDAADEVDQSMKKSTGSIREARGETMLLGEAFGVHLPREVRTFVAEMPGVNQALNAAFSATAVFFLIEALVQGTEKLADWISSVAIFTSAMKESDAAIATMNKTLEQDATDFEKAQKALNDFGKSASELAGERVKTLGVERDALESKFAQEEAQLKAMGGDYKTYGKTIDEVGGQVQETFHKLQAVRAELALAMKEAAAEDEKDAKKSADEWEKAADTRVRVSQHALDVVASNAALEDKAVTNSIKVQEAEYASLGATVEKVTPGFVSDFQKMIEAQMKARDAAHFFGQETRGELQEALDLAVKKFIDLKNGGEATTAQLEAAGQAVIKLRVELNNFGAANPVASVNTDLMKMVLNLDTAEKAATVFGSELNEAFIKAATGSESWSKAMEKSAGSALSSLSQWCTANAMAQLAQGLSWAANPVTASLAPGAFEAAAEWEAAALATGIAGAAIAGSTSGGGGGGSYSGTGTSGNVTSGGGAAPGPASTVTKLSGGGLINQQTLAMIGDSASGGNASEAVLPLENDEVMGRLADAVVSRMGGGVGPGGSSHTFNGSFFGQLRHSDLKRLTRQINQAVNKGTATLKSTQTGRVIKRSA
ncbi:MAG TPA: hypothetical protein VN950_19065 [Terriglobales bacterium]|nr:hypothetical protein [Terriglobales bacterium]